MRGRVAWVIGLCLVLATPSLFAKEKTKGKQNSDAANKEKLEQSLDLLKAKKSQSSGTEAQTKKSTPSSTRASRKRNQVPYERTQTKPTAPARAEKKEGKGLLPSLKSIFNGTNDYFIDKNGDGVSDWWERKKSVRVKPKSPQTTGKTRKDTKRETKTTGR